MHVVTGATLDRWTALSDEDVVTRVLEGQTGLYEVLMRRYNERIYLSVGDGPRANVGTMPG